MPPLFVRDDPEAPGLMRKPQEKRVGFRASMLPIGNYEDGSVAFPVWPQSAVDAKNALMRFGNATHAATSGEPWSPAETFPRDEDAVLAGLAMTGAGFAPWASRGAAGNINLVDPIRARWINRTAPEGPVAVHRAPPFEARNPLNIGGRADLIPETAANDARGPMWHRPYPDAPLTDDGDLYLGAWETQTYPRSWHSDKPWDRLASMGFHFSPEARRALLKHHAMINEENAARGEPWRWAGDGEYGDPVAGFHGNFGATPWNFNPKTGEPADKHFFAVEAWKEYERTRPHGPPGVPLNNYPDDYFTANAPDAAPAGALAMAAASERGLFSNPKEAAPAGVLASSLSNRVTFTPEMKDFIKRNYASMDEASLAEGLGIDRKTLRTFLNASHDELHLRLRAQGSKINAATKIGNLDMDRVKAALDEGVSIREIAQAHGVDHSYLAKRLAKEGIREQTPVPDNTARNALAVELVKAGASYDETANKLGMTRNAVAGAISRAKAKGLYANPKEAAPAGLLAMDAASRMKRAKALGFDTDKTWYHGTNKAFDTFSPEKRGSNTGAPSADVGYFFTDRPATASYYSSGNSGNIPAAAKEAALIRDGAEQMASLYEQMGDVERAMPHRQRQAEAGGPSIIPTHLRMQNPLIHDFKGRVFRDESYRDIIDRAVAKGHDGVIFKNTYDAGEYSKLDALLQGRLRPENIAVAFDPKNIRSKFAAFDPAKSDSANLLAANNPKAAPAGILATSGLDRLKAEEAAKPRSIPDAPQSFPELESYVGKNFENGSGNRVIAARDQDPQRYWDYANGLHDVLHPESEWMMGAPTLHAGGSSGGLLGAVGGPAPGLMRQPEEAPAPGLMRMAKSDYRFAPPQRGTAMPPRLPLYGDGFTQDMLVPPDWPFGDPYPRVPVTGPRLNPPVRPLGPGFRLVD